MKSPLNVTYNDLIEAAENRLAWMESEYPKKVIAGAMNERTARHNIAVQKTLVRLLKKCKREKQGDLFAAFEKMR